MIRVSIFDGSEFGQKLIGTIITYYVPSPASNIDKDPYELKVKCHLRAQCGKGGGRGSQGSQIV